MADHSLIEWTDATWNPITGCSIVDAGCTNCYAMGLAASRMKNHPSRAGLTRLSGNRHVWTGEVRFNHEWLEQPLRWTKPRMIFVCAHGDLFHKAVPDEWIDRVFAVMALCPQHTFQVLTKRPERARAYLMGMNCDGARRFSVATAAEQIANNFPVWDGNGYRLWDGYAGKQWDIRVTSVLSDCPWPLPNVWLGTSISDQHSAEDRIPQLLAAPAAVRFVSAEPLLGPVDLTDLRPAFSPLAGDPHALTGRMIYAGARGYDDSINACAGYTGKIDWVIVGGESGRNARPMHPDWARDLRDQCQETGTAFFFKQWGEWAPARAAGIYEKVERLDWTDGTATLRIGKKAAGRLLDGELWNELPKTPARGGTGPGPS